MRKDISGGGTWQCLVGLRTQGEGQSDCNKETEGRERDLRRRQSNHGSSLDFILRSMGKPLGRNI